MKKLIILLLSVFALFPGFTAEAKNSAKILKSRQRLAQAESAKDSIRILYDILDLSPREDYPRVGREIDKVAERSGDVKTRYDVARQIANSIYDDPTLAEIEKHVRSLPKSKEQRETELFVKIRRLAVRAKRAGDDERKRVLSETMALDDYNTLDEYQKIERLYTICEYLSGFVKGDMLVEYLDDLSQLMKDSDIESYSLYNVFYTESANIYSSIGESEKALAADRELLNVIDNLEKKYQAQGRMYRNYNLSRYVIYRRMLSNYKSLSVDEVNELYGKIRDLCQLDEEVAEDFALKSRTAAYHAMKNGRYVEALSFIRRQLRLNNTVAVRRQMLEMMLEAAKATGDSTAIELASRDLEVSQREYAMLDSLTKYHELQLRYDLNMLKSENSRLELQNKNNEITSTRRLMGFVMVGWVIFGILVIVLLFYWTRYRRTSNDLREFVRSLSDERDELKQRTYREYESKNGKKLAHTPTPKLKNLSEIMNYIINDVLYISSLGVSTKSHFKETFPVRWAMKNAVPGIENTGRADLSIDITYPDENFEINTDKECLEYTLNHLVRMAVKMAPQNGTVGISCREDKTLKMAVFSVWHSGMNIPEGEEEKLFENFVNYKSLSEGGEAALFMCRMVNFFLTSSLRADKSYKNGGRVMLMVPLK